MAAFSLARFLDEIRRRRVIGVVALYVVGAFVALQVADLAFPGLDIPESSIRFVWIGAILGLPLAVLFAWRFDITMQGIRRTPKSFEDPAHDTLRMADYLVLTILFAAIVTMLFSLGQKITDTQGMFEATSSLAKSSDYDPPEYSIAVLPFENLSSDPEQEYFVAGMQDTLIGKLAAIGGLIVISRTSTLRYKESTLTIPEIARELNVAMIVEGSVFKSGEQIRINIQLIGAEPERHLLSQDYDNDLTRVLELQRDVTEDIAEKIRVNLTAEEQIRITSARRVNPQAYENYLKGWYFTNQFTPDSMDTAVTYFDQAISLDPDDPLPYVGLATAYTWIGVGHGRIPENIAFPQARRALNRALQIDATLAAAHSASGSLSLFTWDWIAAESEFQLAIQFQPNSADARDRYATYLQAMRRHDDAILESELAAQLDPLSQIILANLAVNFYAGMRYDRAINTANEALELDPNFAPALWILGESYLATTQHGKAVEAFQKAASVQPTFTFDLAQTYAAIGRVDDARAILNDATPEMKRSGAGKIAEVYAELGEFDRAFESLEIAFEVRTPWLFWIRLDPVYEGLRSDPRYDDLVQRMNFPE